MMRLQSEIENDIIMTNAYDRQRRPDIYLRLFRHGMTLAKADDIS